MNIPQKGDIELGLRCFGRISIRSGLWGTRAGRVVMA